MKIQTAAVSIIISLAFSTASLAMPDMKAPAEAEPVKSEPVKLQPIVGKALEVIHSSGYTYLLVEADGVKDWVAIPELYVEVGDDVELNAGVQMGEWKSKALNRTFKPILFSSGPTEKYNEKRKANAHMGANMNEPAPGKKKSATTIVEGLKVEKAKGANAYDLAEVFEKKAALQAKIISVRGQVIKVTTGVMDKNWVHLKDGTGENGSNKLVITTKETPDTGEIVTFTGVFHNNVDFGGGYFYAIIMEDASTK